MYVTAEIVAAAEAALGVPRVLSMTYEILPAELAMIRASQNHGRAHDVTTVLYHESDVAAIAKPQYPPSIYRIPGGGLQPGEPLASGAAREAEEETGLRFAPTHYPLRVSVRFTCSHEYLDWTTHVVSAVVSRRDLVPTDTHEIAAARWVSWAELLGPIQARMLASGRPLLAYRAALHRAIYETMSARGLLTVESPISQA